MKSVAIIAIMVASVVAGASVSAYVVAMRYERYERAIAEAFVMHRMNDLMREVEHANEFDEGKFAATVGRFNAGLCFAARVATNSVKRDGSATAAAQATLTAVERRMARILERETPGTFPAYERLAQCKTDEPLDIPEAVAAY